MIHQTEPSPSLRVLFVDDHAMVRQAISSLLSQDSRFELVGALGSRSRALEAAARERPDVVVMDYTMPDGGALALIADLRRRGIDCRILILTVHESAHYAVRAIESGADGFLVKSAAVEELKEALLAIASGQIYLPREVSSDVIESLRTPRPVRLGIDALSEREFELLRALGRGLGIKEAATELSVSVSTASTYRGRMIKKLGLRSTPELIRFAIENRID